MNPEKQNTSLNILLAEDDVDDRIFFDRALSNIPISTNLTIVKDGEELMKYLFDNLNNLPSVLFLDLSMPRKTGFECLNEISEDERLKDLPIIVFTTSFGRDTYFEQSLINTLSNMGTLEYVRKTFDITLLQEIIHKALIKIMKKGSC